VADKNALQDKEEDNMSSFRRFEDIDAWKKARELTKSIYRETKTPTFTDTWLKDQILRCLVSITGCVAEGFEKGGTEFQHYLTVSKCSCGEVKCLLYMALDQGYLSQEAVERLIKQAEDAARCIGGLAYYLKNNPSGYNAKRRFNSDGQNGNAQGYYQQNNRNNSARNPEPVLQNTESDDLDF